MTGIILAGGENRRMGADKAFLEFQGRPLIAQIVDLFSQLFRTTVIVTNSPERYSGYAAEVVQDAVGQRGPLTGIYSGLRHSRDEYNFVAACDMPFLNAGLIKFMAGAAHGYDAVVPKIGTCAEPLHAVYAKRILPLVDATIAAGEQRIQALYDRIAVRYVSAEEIDSHDPSRRSFWNVNTPDEYKEAACLD